MEKLFKILSTDRKRLFIPTFYWELDRQQVWNDTVLWEYYVYVTDRVRHGGHKHKLDVWHIQRVPIPRQVNHVPVLLLSYIKIKIYCNIVHISVVFYSNRTASTVLLTSGFLGNLRVYLYICMDITMVTQYSYYYYQQTGKWLDLVYCIINCNRITGNNLDVTCNSSCRWDVKKTNA